MINVLLVDYNNLNHKKDFIYLLNEYALDPMGGGAALTDRVKENLAESLAKVPTAFSYIAYVDQKPAGLINCFEGFSTFACAPLINIHDLVVAQPYRGQGFGLKLLERVEQHAKDLGCCKITLEVLSNNEVAKSAYAKFGFAGYELDPEAGQALFWQKQL